MPWYCKHLSKGCGEVKIVKYGEQEFYLFYTFRGFVDNYSGFIYLPDEQVVDAAKTYFIQVQKMYAWWYYCAST